MSTATISIIWLVVSIAINLIWMQVTFYVRDMYEYDCECEEEYDE